MIRASRHTVITNIVQQLCAVLLLLFLPNILGKTDYAQIVYIAVLLSFIGFADIGLTQAYSRSVPALFTQERHDQIKIWDNTTLCFGLIAASIYSLVIAVIYYQRYGDILNALLLAPVPLIIFWFSFHITRITAKGDFNQYRQVNTKRSIASLIAFPLAHFYGLTGWFCAQLLAALFALVTIGRQLFEPLGKVSWPLVKQHIYEGLILSSISVLWLQLLNFARLYASMSYEPETIATYGIIGAAYQSFSALVISVFLPVSVGILRKYGNSEQEAIEFCHSVICRSLPWLAPTVFAALIGVPIILTFCFPSYYFDNSILISTLLSIILYPFFIVWGNLLLARKKLITYIIIIITGLTISTLSASVFNAHYTKHGAAYGQLIGIMSYTLLLFMEVSNFSDNSTKSLWLIQRNYLLAAYVCIGAVILISSFMRWL